MCQGIGWSLALIFMLGGCASVNPGNNEQLQTYPAPVFEATWIRNGEPISFEGSKWYPVNDYEVMDDSEVYQVGAYRGVKIFVAKIDAKPYDRIYTKFGRNKFRYFQRRDDD